MNLLAIPPDKIGHALMGALVAGAAASVTILAGEPRYAAHAAVMVAIVAGLLKEAADAVTNMRATGKWLGVPRGTPHGIEGLDALATAMGAAPVALPLILKGLT